MDKNNQLLKELLIRGISPAEAEQLAYFARKFSYLSTFERCSISIPRCFNIVGERTLYFGESRQNND